MGSGQLLDKPLPANRERDADGEIRAAHSALLAS
jgi:hypothetical protein